MKHDPARWRREEAIHETLLVRFRDGVTHDHPEVRRHLSGHGATPGDPVGTIAHRIHPPRHNSEALARALVESGLAEYAEPDMQRHATKVPNDTAWLGSGAKIFFTGYYWPSAWELCTGDASVSVAVLDSGCDVNHEDLTGKILNPWSILNSNTTVTDTAGHGTFCCSTIGANTNNSLGAFGVAWDCKITPVQITSGGSLPAGNLAAGIDWVRLNATAKVISCSYAPNAGWGSNAFTATEALAIANAWSVGIICCLSASDFDVTSDGPTGAPQAVIVGSTNAFQSKSSPSNDGTSVTIVACGAGYGAVAINTDTGTFGGGGSPNEAGYDFFNGCSQACPVVAGLLALMLAAKPGATASQLISCMMQNTFPTTGFTAPIRAINPWAAVAAIKSSPVLMGCGAG